MPRGVILGVYAILNGGDLSASALGIKALPALVNGRSRSKALPAEALIGRARAFLLPFPSARQAIDSST